MPFSDLAQVLAGALGGQGVSGQVLQNDALKRKSLMENEQLAQSALLKDLLAKKQFEREAPIRNQQQALSNLFKQKALEQGDQRIKLLQDQRDIVNEIRKNEKLNKKVEDLSAKLEKTGLSELPTVLERVNETIGIEKEGEVPGFGITAFAPDLIISQAGKDARQAVATLQNMILKARSGAAVTENEAKRMLNEIGVGVTRTDKQLRQGIKNTVNVLKSKFQNTLSAYDEDVRNEFKLRGGRIDFPQFGKTSGSGLTKDEEKELEELLRLQNAP